MELLKKFNYHRQVEIHWKFIYSKHEYVTIPCIVIIRLTIVKEQCQILTQQSRGHATITFDFRGWGESRIIENEMSITQDLFEKAKIFNRYLMKLKTYRNWTKIVSLALEYVPHCIYVSRFLITKMYNQWRLFRHGFNKKIIAEAFGGQETIDHLIQLSQEAKTAENPVLIEAASNTNEHDVSEAILYRRKRGLIPEYDNQFNVASWENWSFDSVETEKTSIDPFLLFIQKGPFLLNKTTRNILDDYVDLCG